jgi:hypothetical protein
LRRALTDGAAGETLRSEAVMIRIALACLMVLAAMLPAQQGVVRLQPANARLEQEFSDLNTLRELADGRVLLFDRREERLVVADFATGSVRDVARKGQGPKEFEFVAALLPLPGDSTIAADQTSRWLILVGDSVVAKVLPDHPALQRVSLAPSGSDRRRVQLALAGNQHIFGFGASSVYVIETDTDGIQRLRRHPWSPSPRP